MRHSHIQYIRFISNHNIVVLREIIEDDIVQVKVESSELVNHQQTESVRHVNCFVDTACKLARGKEGF